MAIHLGTSGYVYAHWKRTFYPDKLPAARWLDYYARVFNTCELNNTFYMLPKASAVDGWRERTPPGFVFGGSGRTRRTCARTKGTRTCTSTMIYTRWSTRWT